MLTYHKHGMRETITLYFFIAQDGTGITGENPVAAIRKNSSGEWLDDAKTAWQDGYNDIAMAELDATNLPGIYTLEITHIDDTAEEYEIYFKNTGTYAGSDFEVHEFTGQVYVPASSSYAEGTIRGAIDEMKSRDANRDFDQSLHSLQAIYEDGIVAAPVNVVSALSGSISVKYAESLGSIEVVKGDAVAIPYGPFGKDITGRRLYFAVKQAHSDEEYAIAVKEITGDVTDFTDFTGLINLLATETDLDVNDYYAEIESRDSDGTGNPLTEIKFTLSMVDEVIA